MGVKRDYLELRGTGRTTNLILNAPMSALFFCQNDSMVKYIKDLCLKHARSDLKIYTVDTLNNSGRYKFIGLRLGGVVLDHDLKMTQKQQREIQELLYLVRK